MAPAVEGGGEEVFSNPIAPANLPREDDAEEKNSYIKPSNLTNADFRKMLMTPGPRSSGGSNAASKGTHGLKKSSHPVDREKIRERELRLRDKKQKKSEYLEYKKATEARQKELNEKYRDRAGERRTEQKNFEIANFATPANPYAPTASTIGTMADRRKQTIQESKFLGGDMEHTHLVKGLDFALLQKMREEMAKSENTEKVKKVEVKKVEKKPEPALTKSKLAPVTDEGVRFKSSMAENVHRILFQHRPPERNELFSQNRMAYVVELDDEFAESDIPTTLIRSKAEAKVGTETRTLSNNDNVINKLTQILSYLRQGNRGKKHHKKKDKGKFEQFDAKPVGGGPPTASQDDDIFTGVGEYVPAGLPGAPAAKSLDKPVSYFGEYDREQARKEEERQVQDAVKRRAVEARKLRLDALQPQDSYMECYPGMMEETATYDSDEEADYSKMDMGNKKGPLTRWDFDSEDKYNSYMDNREALPKAAFQFGIKMSEGRKTKRHTKAADEKQKLDREMQKINALLNKRKATGGGEGGAEKTARYN